MQDKISKMAKAAIDGEESACEVFAELKNLQVQIASALKVVTPYAMDEARSFNKGEVYFGGTWAYRATPSYLDFSKDQIVCDLNSKVSERKTLLKFAQKMKGQVIVDEETGEPVPVLDVKTPSSEILIYKAK